MFNLVDEIAPKDTVIASNTSSISISKIASCTERPHNVIGMHFFHPVPIMNLVEVIKGLQTSEETANLTEDLSKAMGKELVFAKDIPGRIYQ